MAANDPYFGNVSLLLHGDGAQDGTVFTDVKGHAITRYGSAITRTDQKKYGSASIYFDGSGDRLSTASLPEFNLGSGDFTVELWAYLINGGHGQAWARLLQIGSNSTSGGLWITCTNMENPTHIFADGWVSGSYQRLVSEAGAPTLTNNAWHHIALCRASGAYSLWVDGTAYGTPQSRESYVHVQGAIHIGSNEGSGESFYGYLDDIRITKGLARYTGAFTPPAGPFPDYGRYVAGTIIEDSAHTDWLVRTYRLDNGALLSGAIVTGGSYELPCVVSGNDYSGPVVVSCMHQCGVAWSANTGKSVGDYVFPSDPTATPYVFQCTTAGTTHGTTEPEWDTAPGNTTSDGTVTWTCLDRLLQPLIHGPLVPRI